EEDIFGSLDLLAAQCPEQPTSLRDILLLEPEATLHVLFDPIGRRDGLTDAEFDALDARLASAARRLATDENVRRAFLAIDASAPEADLAALQQVRELLEGTEQAQGGAWSRLFGPILGAFTRLAVVQAKSPGVYVHGGRFFGDSVRYFSQRGTREAPGEVVRSVLAQIRNGMRDFPDDSPTVFLTHSLGSALFYDLFTYFARGLSFDLWISVGSQVGYYEDAKLLANSSRAGGGYYGAPIPEVPAKVRVPLPPGARWFDVRDPRDPIAFPAAPVFENVVDVSLITRNHNFFEIHNAYFTDSRFGAALVDILNQTFAGAPARSPKDPGAGSLRR
ncbi:MAG TPA: hypothetical protein VK841_27075, partial [Polyangiaceae bacterium]|nr:hypothetical protein [Polyangiaceae bacterium]